MSDRLCPECRNPVHGRAIHIECKRIRDARKNASRSAQQHNTAHHRRIRNILITWNPDAHCWLCGATENLTVDYITPVAQGGPMSFQNARVLCRSCNSRKGAGERVSHR